MDYFLIFRFELLQTNQGPNRLDSLQVELLKQQDEKYSNSTKFHFTNLAFSNNFKEAITTIMKKIHQINLSFTNIKFICEDSNLFTHILPSEFNLRALSMPYIFTNFVDWKNICRHKYAYFAKTLQDTAKFFHFMQLNDPIIIIKMLIKKLRQDKAIDDTDVSFTKQYIGKEQNESFSYFRCIGLPFQITKNQFVQKIIQPDHFNIKSYGFSLIFQHGKFSGKAVVKIPSEYAQMVLKKDRMYIGRRYVQISTISQEEYEGYKIREEKQRQDSKNRDYRERRGGRSDRSSSSSGSRSRSRSRQKTEIHSLLNEAAIKVRGLPYSLNSWDIEQIFKRFNFVRGSIKLGLMGERKSGEAMILFPNRQQAERAMNLQGFVVHGRYLELKVVNKQSYDRFK